MSLASLAAESTAGFENHRARLWALAYRMLSSCADADDMVQETYLRWHQAQRDDIASPEAWLITACTRLCIDQLRSARRRRVDYVGPWLPEPLVESLSAPAHELEQDESVTVAFLLLLERLPPLERATYVLHEIFGVAHAEIGAILRKTPVTARQILSRARKRLAEGRQRSAPPHAQQERLLQSFLAALKTGDVAALTGLLAEDAALQSDGGGKARSARRTIRGRERIARLLVGILRKQPAPLAIAPARINARPGLVLSRDGSIHSAVTFDWRDAAGPVADVYMMRNPEKLHRVAVSI